MPDLFTFAHRPLPQVIEPGPTTEKSVRAVIDDESICIQQKLDGHRILVAVTPDDEVLVQNREGIAYKQSVSHIEHDLKALATVFRGNDRYIALDGELMPSGLYVFDCPLMKIKATSVQRISSFDARENAYRFVLGALTLDSIHPVPTARTQHEKMLLLSHLLDIDAEGFVTKRKQSTYHDSAFRTKNLQHKGSYGVKFKFTHDVDTIVMRQRGEKDSVAVGLLDVESKKVKEIGACSTIGKGELHVGDVVKVKYLYVGADGRLVQPRIIEKRTDKKATECTTSQPLSHVNKDVILDIHKKVLASES